MLVLIKKQEFLSRIMKDYKNFPPVNYMIRVLKNCPKSAFLYLQIWKKQTKNRLEVKKESIRKDYLISPTMFRNLLSPLMFLNIISFLESDTEFQIDMMGHNSDD